MKGILAKRIDMHKYVWINPVLFTLFNKTAIYFTNGHIGYHLWLGCMFKINISTHSNNTLTFESIPVRTMIDLWDLAFFQIHNNSLLTFESAPARSLTFQTWHETIHEQNVTFKLTDVVSVCLKSSISSKFHMFLFCRCGKQPVVRGYVLKKQSLRYLGRENGNSLRVPCWPRVCVGYNTIAVQNSEPYI